MQKRLERILPRVQKPARYVGGEFNEIKKDKSSVKLRMAFCFPDTYEIGMSNVGLRILYGSMNTMKDVWCERCFAPWSDMEEEVRKAGIPLYALESGDPICEFDAIGFSLGYEMAYTATLNMLDLAGLPIRSEDRKELLPLVFAGGTSCTNPEPMAAFLDLMVIGEGEEINNELLKLLIDAKARGISKADFLLEAAQLEGVYVPSLYEAQYGQDGTVSSFIPKQGAPERVKKRIMKDFDGAFFPEDSIVPSTEIVHDRVNLELFRGCVRGCRFCQAGYAYRPVRTRSAERLVSQGTESLKNSGYQEVTLSSLSTSDYPELMRLCDGLMDFCESRSMSLSLPSLRADNFSMDIMKRVQKVRKSGLTFAPEAGSQRLRNAINKNVDEEDLIRTCRVAFEGGWNNLKLYFMLGLPTETDEDVVAISEMANKVLHCWRQHSNNKNRGVRITISTSCFIPKPHTPFQWEPQVSIEEYLRKVKLLRESLTAKNVNYNWHEAETSLVEAVLSRGDRRIADVIEKAFRSGSSLDAWSDYFDFGRWKTAFEECGIDPAFYANRLREQDEIMPWDVIDLGVSKKYLWRERERCYESVLTPDCREKCTGCGASKLNGGICDGRA